jgi:hypothetical protein
VASPRKERQQKASVTPVTMIPDPNAWSNFSAPLGVQKRHDPLASFLRQAVDKSYRVVGIGPYDQTTDLFADLFRFWVGLKGQ